MEILLLSVLILLNGVFAMSELALVASHRARLESAAKNGKSGAVAALELKRDPNRFLSTVQVGITSIGLLNGIVGEAALAGPIADWLQSQGLDEDTAGIVATVAVVGIITYVSIVVGELVPKRIAQVAPERVALIVAAPMRALALAGKPFVWLLAASTEALLSLLRIRERAGPPITIEEIHAMLAEGSSAGVIEHDEHRMVRRVFDLDDRRILSLMTPRRDMETLDLRRPVRENLERMVASRHSQFPVIDGDANEILGIVHVKRLAHALIHEREPDLRALLEPALFVPESATGRDLLANLRAARSVSALVVDEYGDVQGLVTLNDLMRAIAGDVEGVAAEGPAIRREDGSWLLDGLLSTIELREILNLQSLPDEGPGNYDSLGGMMMAMLGRIPHEGDIAHWEGWRFEVVDIDGRRVDKVLAWPPPPDEG